MPDQKISTFPNATILSGVEKITGLQGGVNKNIELDLIKSYVNTGIQGGIVNLKTTLTSSQILNLFSVPIDLAPAPGTGKLIVPLNLVTKYNFNSILYTGNPLFVSIESSGASVFSGINNYKSGGSVMNYFNMNAGQYLDSSVNKKAQISTFTENPLAGNGTLDVYFTYFILTV